MISKLLNNRRLLIIISISSTTALMFLLFFLGFKNYLEPKLGDFEALRIIEENQNFYLEVSKSHNALKYEVTALNQQGEEILKTESEDNKILLKNLTANYNDILKFKITAKNKNGTKKEAKEIYEYTWKYASLINLNTRYINADYGLVLSIYGYQQNETYQIKLEYLNQVIYEEKLETENVIVPYEKLEGYAGRISAKLYTKDGTHISSYSFFINTPIVGKIAIKNPGREYRTRWNDIKFNFEGGENATSFYLLVYEEGYLTHSLELPKETKEYTLPAEYLNEARNYQFKIEARYMDYYEITESDTISCYVGKKETTNPVYVSHNPTFIKKGTQITLDTRTSNATIYYTLDGSTPTKDSSVYTNPITINENTVLKTYAESKRRNDSATNTYNFEVKEKQLVVYLSPSNQYWNIGNAEAGYTNEMKEMNKVADVVEHVLKENGVTVYRNKSSGHINQYLSESNYVKSDLHLAIHSNASSTKQARGIEIFVDSPTSKSLSVATHIYQNLYNIYIGKNMANTDRGVKYANGSLGEANDSFIPCGTLIEIAYHDNYDDAKWILENREAIGNNIARSIINYYN